MVAYVVVVRDKERESKNLPQKIANANRQIAVFSHKKLVKILELIDNKNFELLDVKNAGALENESDFEKEVIERNRPNDLNINLKKKEEKEEE